MTTLIIPDVDDATLARLRTRAADQGRSEADEARRILQESLGSPAEAVTAPETLAQAMRSIFSPLGGHEFPMLREAGERPPPDFSEPEYGIDPDET